MTEHEALPFDAWELAAGSGDYEQAAEALSRVVEAMETGGLRLMDTIRCFELGAKLGQRCERLLDEAELRITVLGENSPADTRADLAAEVLDGI